MALQRLLLPIAVVSGLGCDARVCDGTDKPGRATFSEDGGRARSWARALSGDVIITSPGELRICPGVWRVNLSVEADDVSIRGYGQGVTILEGDGAGAVLRADHVSGLELESLTLTGGSGQRCSRSDLQRCGGGLPGQTHQLAT